VKNYFTVHVHYEFFLPPQCFYLLTYKIWGMLQPTRPKSGTFMSYENALWTNGISWISTSSTKWLESGERDFELVWSQEKDIGLYRLL